MCYKVFPGTNVVWPGKHTSSFMTRLFTPIYANKNLEQSKINFIGITYKNTKIVAEKLQPQFWQLKKEVHNEREFLRGIIEKHQDTKSIEKRLKKLHREDKWDQGTVKWFRFLQEKKKERGHSQTIRNPQTLGEIHLAVKCGCSVRSRNKLERRQRSCCEDNYWMSSYKCESIASFSQKSYMIMKVIL